MIAFNKKSHEDSDELFKGESFRDCVNALREKMDFIIIDTPPASVSADAVTVSVCSDSTLLVIRTDCVPVRDINDAILTFSDAGCNIEGCILNNVYKPFTLFGQIGADERGYHGYGNYYGYSKYSKPVAAEDVSAEGFSPDSLESLNRNDRT